MKNQSIVKTNKEVFNELLDKAIFSPSTSQKFQERVSRSEKKTRLRKTEGSQTK